MADSRDLEILCRVIELKSFSRAAEELHLTQPTISGHIIDLEKRLGVKLLDRLGKEVLPTKSGSLLYDYGKRILALLDEAKQSLEEFKDSLKGNLLLGGSTIPGAYILPSLMGQFKERYPEVSIVLRVSDSQGIVDEVLDGSIEIGVVGARIGNNKIEYRKFVDDESIFICPKNHRFAKRGSLSLDDLKKEPFILRERGSGTRMAVEKGLRVHNINTGNFNVIAEVETTEAVKQGVKSGLGISFISRRAVQEELKHGTLRELKVNGLEIKRAFYVIKRRGKTMTPLCHLFFNFLIKSSQG